MPLFDARKHANPTKTPFWTTFEDQRVGLRDFSIADTTWSGTAGQPGLASIHADSVFVQCKEGLLRVNELDSRTGVLSAREWWNGESYAGRRRRVQFV
jgi:methionyl-tRNA formyltransferase